MNLVVAHTGINLVYLGVDSRYVLAVLNVQLDRILLLSPAQNKAHCSVYPFHIVAYRIAKILYDVGLKQF